MRIPLATYRLQFNPDFRFPAARAILPYLADLGVSDIYASPVFAVTPGSTHGYDVADPNEINPELGGRPALEELIGAAAGHGLGWLQDIVPNHMAFHPANRMLMDIFEFGADSPYFRFFDADWDHPDESLHGRLLTPVLGRPYGEALAGGDIRLVYGEGRLAVEAGSLRFPLLVESYPLFLAPGAEDPIDRPGGPQAGAAAKLRELLNAWPLGPEPGLPAAGRHRHLRALREGLAELDRAEAEVHAFIERRLTAFNGQPGETEALDRLDQLLARQRFRLSYWKVATEEIDYRRFFNINGLICLRLRDEAVIRETHALILELVRGGRFTGLRIDHVDGLFDPGRYLKYLRDRIEDVYVVVEKILAPGESLPAWPVQGTSGYDFLNLLNGVFCRTGNRRAFDRVYVRFTGLRAPFRELVAAKKKLILEKHMTSDLDNLARMLKTMAARQRSGRDLTFAAVRRATAELMARFPVYRTYIDGRARGDEDLRYTETALRAAAAAAPDVGPVFDYLGSILFPRLEAERFEDEPPGLREFVMRLQQFTGPLAAKGFEDTVLYIYNRLLSLNEVGGDPEPFGLTRPAFHRAVRERARAWPQALNATATHDTKRGEDVRARLNVLSELPRDWSRELKAWGRSNRKLKTVVNGERAPDANDEYFLYQTLLGAFPPRGTDLSVFRDRVRAYALKAIREAKVHTAWLKPDESYEQACLAFLDHLLDPGSAFMAAFRPFERRIAFYGVFNSLSQVLLKAASPGVPDFYQGTELWDLSLVDPDNRRSVDFDLRSRLLRSIEADFKADPAGLVNKLLEDRQDGRVKLFLTWRVLRARRRAVELFQQGDYRPLEAAGAHADSVIAFSRGRGADRAVVAAPRFLTSVVADGRLPIGPEVWRDTEVLLPAGASGAGWEAITGRVIAARERLPAGELFATFPGALLLLGSPARPEEG